MTGGENRDDDYRSPVFLASAAHARLATKLVGMGAAVGVRVAGGPDGFAVFSVRLGEGLDANRAAAFLTRIDLSGKRVWEVKLDGHCLCDSGTQLIHAAKGKPYVVDSLKVAGSRILVGRNRIYSWDDGKAAGTLPSTRALPLPWWEAYTWSSSPTFSVLGEGEDMLRDVNLDKRTVGREHLTPASRTLTSGKWSLDIKADGPKSTISRSDGKGWRRSILGGGGANGAYSNNADGGGVVLMASRAYFGLGTTVAIVDVETGKQISVAHLPEDGEFLSVAPGVIVYANESRDFVSWLYE